MRPVFPLPVPALLLTGIVCLLLPLASAWAYTPMDGELLLEEESHHLVRITDSLDKEAATVWAEAEARRGAMDFVERSLAGHYLVRFVGSASSGTPPLKFDTAALGYALTQLETEVSAPDAHSVLVTVRVSNRPAPPDAVESDPALRRLTPFSQNLVLALRNADLLALDSRAIHYEYASLDALNSLLQQPATPANSNSSKEAMTQHIYKLQGIAQYRQLLHTLNGVWTASDSNLQSIESILELDATNALAYLALGDILLQLGRTQQAIKALTEAIKLDPSLDQAYYARGIVQLQLNIPALAEYDFSLALRQDPTHPLYLRSRAAAWHMQADVARMCEDLHAACAYGDCRGYISVRQEGLCSPLVTTAETLAPLLTNATSANATLTNATVPIPTNSTVSPLTE